MGISLNNPCLFWVFSLLTHAKLQRDVLLKLRLACVEGEWGKSRKVIGRIRKEEKKKKRKNEEKKRKKERKGVNVGVGRGHVKWGQWPFDKSNDLWWSEWCVFGFSLVPICTHMYGRWGLVSNMYGRPHIFNHVLPHTAIKKQRKTSTNIYHIIYLFSLSFFGYFLFYFFLSLSLLSTLFVFLSYPNFLFLVGVVGFTKTSKGWGYRMNFNNILFLFLGGVWGTWGKER